MWVDRKDRTPEYSGAYAVYGKVSLRTEHEKEIQFIAYWNNKRFTDSDGEDLVNIDEGVEFWFDFTYVEKPKSKYITLE